jgi:hypothetical protein
MPRSAPQIPPAADGVAQAHLDDRTIQILASIGRIDTENLKQEVEEVGASAIWWGLLTAEAKRQSGLAFMQEDLTKARLNKTVRDDAMAKGDKPTVDQVAAMIQAHPEMQAARLHALNGEATASMIESVKYALVQKSKTLEALAGMIVEELRARQDPTPTAPRRTPLR